MLSHPACLCLALLALGCDQPTTGPVRLDTGDAPTVEDEDTPAWDSMAVFVNEFMAYDPPNSDWIEIYNGSDELVSMTGATLSCDDANEQDPFVFPLDVDVEPGGFLVVICDQGEGEGDGALHAPFRIERHDGTIHLRDQEGVSINSVSYAYQAQGISAARIPDGAATWDFVYDPTPGESNVVE